MSARGHVVLFKGQSQYETVRCMTDDFADGFRDAGFGATVVDIMTEKDEHVVARLEDLHAKGELAFGFGFYAWGVQSGWNKGTIWDRLGVPLVVHLIDPPYAFHDRMTLAANQVVLVHDQAMRSYLDASIDIRGSFAHVHPGGAAANITAPGTRSGLPFLAMTVHDLRRLDDALAAMPPTAQQLVRRMIEAAADDPYGEVHAIALEVLHSFDWLRTPGIRARELQVFRGYMQFAYNYVHALRRARLAPEILQLPVEIAGTGWDQFKVANARAVLRGPLSFRAVEAKLRQTPLMLNVMPPWTDALHDRLLYAMAAGAAVVTTTNRAVETHFSDGHDIAAIQLDGFDLAERVDALLADPAACRAQAEAAQATFLAHHTWRHRAEQVAAIVAEHGAAAAT